MSFFSFLKKKFSKKKKKKAHQTKDQHSATSPSENNSGSSSDTQQAPQVSVASITNPTVTSGEAQEAPQKKQDNDVLSTSVTSVSQQEQKPTAPKKKQKRSFFASIKRLFLGRPNLDDELLDELEELLITRDMGVKTANKLIKKIKKEGGTLNLDKAVAILKKETIALLDVPTSSSTADAPPPQKPYVVLVIGVNGVGKTTTIGKLAYLFKQEKKKVMICAGDTFRAAAVEQIKIWGERLNVPVVSHGMHKDPGAVVFDAVEKAITQEVDVLLVDTAGRLHNKVGLMNELAKIKRVIGKKLPGGPQEILLVVDGSTGQNAWQQAKMFNEKLALNSLAVTKLDGVGKGGVLIGLSSEIGIPIKYIGLGETMTDIAYFNAHDFVEQLFAR